MLDAATNKLLHAPVTRLRALAKDPRCEDYLEAMRDLFELPLEEAVEPVVAPEPAVSERRGSAGGAAAGLVMAATATATRR